MELKTGDIFAVRGRGIFGWLHRKLLIPYTDRFHLGLLGDYVPEEDDWVILESIDRGVAVGRLSFYNLEDLKFYTPKDSTFGVQAALQATKHGRARYDYGLFLHIIYYGVKALITNYRRYRIFKAFYYDIPNKTNARLICTELVGEAYRGLASVFDNRYEATPANFQKQVDLGYIHELK